jgi:hypothetical protein
MWIIDPNKCSNIMVIGHTKGRPGMGRIAQGKETKNLNVIDLLTV